MKILCLADLHIGMHDEIESDKVAWLSEVSKGADLILVAGDVFESDFKYNPYETLNTIFQDRPVVCVLGNHEFFFKTVDGTLSVYDRKKSPMYNVHYLDIENFFDYGGMRIVGNFLGYDGSMTTVPNQQATAWFTNGWADRYIVNYNNEYKKHCDTNKIKIQKALQGFSGSKILLTHTVPHTDMNGWIENGQDIKGGNQYNFYSGVKNFLDEVDVDYSISGHTHKRVTGKIINKAMCINIGNDYMKPYLHYILEV